MASRSEAVPRLTVPQRNATNAVSELRTKWRNQLMKNRLYLTLVVAALLCLAGWTAQAQLQRSSSGRQTWDYKWISLARAANTGEDWSIWLEDDKPLRGPVAIALKIKELGDQGWELVAVTPYSNHSCGSQDCAGFTSQITYYFKRPK